MHDLVLKVVLDCSVLFEELDPDPRTPLKADADVAHGARIHLYHEYDRPLHYGVDDICDASKENAEIFLQFAGELVANLRFRHGGALS